MGDEIQPGPASPAGSVLQPIYSVRSMKCYSVTESELHTISLANLAVTSSVGIASALLAFGIDIFKDGMVQTIPSQNVAVLNGVKWTCILFAVVFYLLAGAGWIWRRGMFQTIRSESQEPGATSGRPDEPPAVTCITVP